MSKATNAQRTADQQLQHDALQPASFKESVRYLGTLPSRPRLGQSLGLATSFVFVLITLVGGSWLIGRLVDVFNDATVPIFGTGTRAFWGIIVTLFFLFTGEQFARGAARYLIAAYTRRISVDLRRACLHATLTAPIPDIQQLGTGNVITRLTKDIDEAVRIANEIGFRLVLAILMFPASLVALIAIDMRLALPMLLAALVVGPFLRRTVRKIPEVANLRSSQMGNRNNILLDTLRGVPTIKAYGMQDWANKRLRASSWKSLQADTFVIPVNSMMLFQATMAYVSFVLFTFLLAGYMGHHGMITGGEAAAAVLIVLRMEMPIFNVLMMIGSIQTASTSLGRAVALAQMEPATQLQDPDDYSTPPAVHIEHLSFGYGDGAPILSDLSVTLEPGTTTAVVGASGAGKSTLASLIAGLLRPTAGTIRVGDVDTSQVSDVWTARQVTFMNQDVHLFSGTLEHDLLMAAPHASREDLEQALAEVGLGVDTPQFQRNFPQGLDSLVGAGAAEVPAAVAQQISLARVLLRQPPVLIMDEATSEAGSDFAKTLEVAATTVTKGRTALVVAHRLDQAIAADRILVMDQGQIVEDGTHEELLAANGPYSTLFGHWSGTL